jgi:Protein of unknown function (DUF1360)
VVVETRPPYTSYAVIMGTFLAGVAGVSALAARKERPADAPGPMDLALLGLATYKASRTLVKDEVASFVREPFVDGHAHDGEDERPAGNGMRQAIGELVTCTRCSGTWIGAGLSSLTILAPRTGRLLTTILAAGAVNDWLLAGFSALTAKANELERRAG